MAGRYQRSARTRRELADNAVRADLAGNLRAVYEAGASIRTLATTHGLSFGTVRGLLLEAGATLRGRGGPNHTTR